MHIRLRDSRRNQFIKINIVFVVTAVSRVYITDVRRFLSRCFVHRFEAIIQRIFDWASDAAKLIVNRKRDCQKISWFLRT